MNQLSAVSSGVKNASFSVSCCTDEGSFPFSEDVCELSGSGKNACFKDEGSNKDTEAFELSCNTDKKSIEFDDLCVQSASEKAEVLENAYAVKKSEHEKASLELDTCLFNFEKRSELNFLESDFEETEQIDADLSAADILKNVNFKLEQLKAERENKAKEKEQLEAEQAELIDEAASQKNSGRNIDSGLIARLSEVNGRLIELNYAVFSLEEEIKDTEASAKNVQADFDREQSKAEEKQAEKQKKSCIRKSEISEKAEKANQEHLKALSKFAASESALNRAAAEAVCAQSEASAYKAYAVKCRDRFKALSAQTLKSHADLKVKESFAVKADADLTCAGAALAAAQAAFMNPAAVALAKANFNKASEISSLAHKALEAAAVKTENLEKKTALSLAQSLKADKGCGRADQKLKQKQNEYLRKISSFRNAEFVLKAASDKAELMENVKEKASESMEKLENESFIGLMSEGRKNSDILKELLNKP